MRRHHPVALSLFAVLSLSLTACLDRDRTTPVAPATDAALLDQGSDDADDPTTIGLQEVASGLAHPVAIVSPGDGSGRLFVVDQVGLIRVIGSDGVLRPTPFLDLRSKLVPLRAGFDERGLLGLAFHPSYESNGRFFVYYNARPRLTGFDNTATFSEFRVSGNPEVAEAASERVFLQLDDAQFNHNGGTIAFGPDGKLYMSIGDGGGANDVGPNHVTDWYEANAGGNGQDTEANLFGNILRIDVDAGMPYGIPSDNPYVGKPGMDEIWAYGFRNPYRFSFDSESGRLIVADVGQGLWEEVNVVTKGGNYGWNVREGRHCFSTATPLVPPTSCPDRVASGAREGDELIDPVLEYRNTAGFGAQGLGRAVVGGFIAHGKTVPQLEGRYVFGDWSTAFAAPGNGSLFVAKPSNSGNQPNWEFRELQVFGSPNGRINAFVLGFGQDEAGDIYVGTSNASGPTGTTGKVFKIVRPGGGQ
jgi:glucose/arabinose dehydrogenase